MSILAFSILLLLVAAAAGLLGSLTGLGGGVVLVPMLVLVFHVDIHYAMGASLIAVLATSSGAGAAFAEGGFLNLRIAVLLELVAVSGAIIGATLSEYTPTHVISIVFGLVLVVSAFLSSRARDRSRFARPSHAWAVRLQLSARYPGVAEPYPVFRVPLGLGLMGLAGLLSGLLGIGAGAAKVLAMDQALGLPYKVSTATSNFMIGITAAAGAAVYFAHGRINPALAMPVMLGVLGGAAVGARIMEAARSQRLRQLFALVILMLGVEMLYGGFRGGL